MAETKPLPTRRGAADAPTHLIHLLNTDEAAESLRVSRRTVQQLAAERKIATIKFGRNLRFDPADLAAFAEANKIKAVGWKGGSK